MAALRRTLTSLAVRAATSATLASGRARVREWRRRLAGRAHRVHAFLQLDDPYSYLLASWLPELARHADVRIDWHLCEARGDAYQPAPAMLRDYALTDAGRVAAALGLPFLDRGATPLYEQRKALLATLAAEADGAGFADSAARALAAYWRGDAEAASRLRATAGADVAALLASGDALRDRLGHYNSAMLHYEGEWYWGVDRLPHLWRRLRALGAVRDAAPRLELLEQALDDELPRAPPDEEYDLPPLELFFSFRSPYSWLALARVEDFANACGVRLLLRPVLPMVARGLPVPRQKLAYIVRDAAREARRHGVPFGRFCEPLGAGIERALAVFALAEREGRALAYATSAARAVWVDGLDLASRRGLRKVVERAGLAWPAARAALALPGWRTMAEHNRRAMTENGIWGVPAFRIGETVLWGQDRLWLLKRLITEMTGQRNDE